MRECLPAGRQVPRLAEQQKHAAIVNSPFSFTSNRPFCPTPSDKTGKGSLEGGTVPPRTMTVFFDCERELKMSSQLRLVTKPAASLLEGTAEPELSCLVLCALSASMNERAPDSEHRKIDQLNAGIQTLPAEILKDAQAARRV